MQRRLWMYQVALLGYLALGLVAGCYVELKCLQDGDCPAGQRCESGVGTCQTKTCQPKSEARCQPSDGHLYWFDSCGQIGALVTQCPQGCEANQCKTTNTCGNTCDQSCTCPVGTFCIGGICSLCRQDSDCGTGNSCVGGRCLHQQSGCSTNADCTGGLVCLQKKCTSCVQDSDCNNGLTCTSGFCLKPQQGVCQSSVDCPSNQVCVNASCRVGQCVKDVDCTNGRCLAYICIPNTGCSANSGCAPGQSCVNGSCQTSACTDGAYRCAATQRELCINGQWAVRPCSAGQFCSAGLCMASGCKADADCAADERCESGKCVLITGTCKSDSDCPASQSCIGGKCAAPPACTDGERKCVGQEIQICRNGQWSLESACSGGQHCTQGKCDSSCKSNADCPSGYLCENASCKAAQCTSDSNCKSGESCRSGRCCDCDGSIPSKCSPGGPGNHILSTCTNKCRWVTEKCSTVCRPDFKDCL